MDVRPIDANVLLDIAKNKYHDIVAGRYPFNIVVYDLVQIIEEQPTLALAPKWISVKERLPEDEAPVLVGYSRNLNGFVCIGYLDYEDMRWCGLDDIRIARPTHWMPLPLPPKEEYK